LIPAQIIASKRDGHSLTAEEISWLVQQYAADEIPEYQMAAFAMATFLNGMDREEVEALTTAMLKSGTRLQWPDDDVCRVDKHSTGGVGDKTSIILAPLLAECGLQVPMLSGRGLGPTGGTLDKLESIDGFRTDLSRSEITSLTRDIGCVITGTTAELAPADRKLYALRDVTGTVPSIPLITASILSKKLAESLDALVLDVKFGSGAFMKSQTRATELARSLVEVGTKLGVPTTALLTDMNQPLGNMCGNAVEIRECVDVLKGGGPGDLLDLTLQLAAELMTSAGIASDRSFARELAASRLTNGSAWERFGRMVRAQGGNLNLDLKIAPAREVAATTDGFVSAIDTEALGYLVIAMGGGRRKLGDAIDHSVGVELHVRVGDRLERGQPWVSLYHASADEFLSPLRDVLTVSDEPVAPLRLVHDRITV